MIIFGIIMFAIGVVLSIVSAFKIGKKDYSISVNLQPDVEQIIEKSVEKFLSKHGNHECNHKWKIIKTGPVTGDNNTRIGYYYDLQCEKCGTISEKRT